MNRYVAFLFYDTAIGRQSRLSFSKDKKHVDVMVYENDTVTCFQYSGKGIEHRVFKTDDILKVLKGIKLIPELSHYILVSMYKEHKGKRWLPFHINSCNEVCRKIGRVEIGWTFNPAHLYKKLVKLNGKTNFTVVSVWSRKNGFL